MWYFTPYGFFSVVKDRQGVGMFLVRTRDRAHLARLHRAFPELSGFAILESPSRDYPYRLRVPRPVWVAVAGKLAEAIIYDNFKNEAEIVAPLGAGGDRYIAVLHDVWTLLWERYADARPVEDPRAR